MTANTSETTAQLLVELGFTTIESAVYLALVAAPPATGYAVAQAIGKPVANTYKALESLAAKGAVTLDDGEPRLCRAVPPAELLASLERAFARRCAAAKDALAALESPAGDDRVYQIRSTDQLYERARALIAGATHDIILDVSPAPLDELRDDLVAAASRSVRIAALVYEPADLPPPILAASPPTRAAFDLWPGVHLAIVADAREHLAAMLNHEGRAVRQAVWSASPFLSALHHDGILSQIALHALDGAIARGQGLGEMRRLRDQFRPLCMLNAPGFQQLRAAHARGAPLPTP